MKIKFRIRHNGQVCYWGFLDNNFYGVGKLSIDVLFVSAKEFESKSEQFINEVDKNGVEIYKGDTVMLNRDGVTSTGRVIYRNAGFEIEDIVIGETQGTGGLSYQLLFYDMDGQQFRWNELEVER